MSLLVTFHSVSDALMVQRRLEATGEKSSVRPTPRSLSTSCGYSLEVKDSANLALRDILQELGKDFGEVFRVEREGRKVSYSEIREIKDL